MKNPFAVMTPGARHAAVFLVVLIVALNGANLLWTSRQVGNLRKVTATVRTEHDVQVYACQLGNESRVQEITLWEHVAAISAAPPHETPRQARARRARIAAFLAYVHRVFAPRDCETIFRLPH